MHVDDIKPAFTEHCTVTRKRPRLRSKRSLRSCWRSSAR